MLLLLIAVYHFVKVSSQCNELGIEVIVGGQYRNKSHVIQETAAQNCQWLIKQGTMFTDVFNWAASTPYDGTNIETVFNIYEDLDGFIANNDTIRYGNVILCNQTLCDNMTRIGPSSTNLFMQYRPVSITTDFNLSHIIHAPLIKNESEIHSHHTDEINIIFYFYAVHYNDTHILDIIADIFEGAVIKNTDYIASIRWNNTVTTSGIITSDYRDVTAVYEHLGDPHLWNQSYYQWNKVPQKYPNAIFYVYAISVLCSNENVCDELILLSPAADDDDEFLKKWKIIGIIFVILLVLAIGLRFQARSKKERQMSRVYYGSSQFVNEHSLSVIYD